MGEVQPFGQGEIRCFTGLRGCAAVLVMVYHFTLHMPAGTVPLRPLLENGYLWVDLFFLLSGFVMAYSQAHHFAAGWRPRAHATFLAERLARIYPLYVVVAVESACLLAWRTGHVDAATIGLNLTMLQGWGLAPSLEGAAWSVSTEWCAYLAFPLLLAATVLSRSRRAALVGVLAALALAALAASAGPFTLPDQLRSGPLDIYSQATPAPLLRCLAEFTLGLLAFRVARHLATPLARQPRVGLISAGALVALFAALARPGLDLAVVALFWLLLVLLSQQIGLPARLLGAAVPHRLGQWSYSIYLLHDKFSHPAERLRRMLAPHTPLASILAIMLISLVVIAASALSHAWIERPLRRLMRRALQPRRPASRRAAEPPATLQAGA